MQYPKPRTPQFPFKPSDRPEQALINHSFFDALPNSAYIRESKLVQSPKRPGTPALLPFSAPTLWRKVKAGTFPKPIKLSERVTCWKVSEVRTWMAAQTAHGYTPALVAKKRSKCISPVAA